MLSKNNNKAVLATLALMLLSLSVASSMAMSKYTKNYANAQGVTRQGGGGKATNAATTKGASDTASVVKDRNKF
jgi:hypothetical protein